MNDEQVPTEQNSNPPSDASRCESRACCPLQSRWGLLLWALLIGAIVYMQWPMLKGMYYRTSSADAPESAVAWRSGFEDALAESAESGKPVLVDFTASWCPPCRVMKHEVWPDEQVASAVNNGYVPLLVDVDDPQYAHVRQRYDIRAIPAVLVLDSNGAVLKTGAFMSRSQMLQFLESDA